MTPPPTPPAVPPAMLDALLSALADEASSLDAFAAAAQGQLATLREGGPEGPARFEEAGLATADALAALDAAEQARARRLRLFARTLGAGESASLAELAARLAAPEAARLLAARGLTRAAAEKASARCASLHFALSYAAGLGRETLAAWRGLGTVPAAHLYTASGGAAPAAPARALVNRTG